MAEGQQITITGTGFGTKANVKPLYWIDLQSNLNPHPTLSRITTALSPDATSIVQTAIKPVGAIGAARVRACTTFLSGSPPPIIFQSPARFTTPDLYVFVKRYRSSAGNRALAVDLAHQDGPLESKALRVWTGPGTGTPDTFIGNGPTGGNSFTEGVPDPVVTVNGAQVGNFHNQVESYDVWVTYEHHFKASSNVNTNDGIWNCARRGLLYHQFLSRWKTATPTATKDVYFDEYSNCSRESLDYFHSIYIDDSPKRVWISSESSYNPNQTIAGGGTLVDREVCIPVAWSDSSVACVVRQGSFGSLAGKYLWVGTDTYSAVRIGQFAASAGSVFPLSVSSTSRYLQTAAGAPFLIHGDTPWSIAAQLTDAQVLQYLQDRASRGVNTILFNAIEHNFTSQTPKYRNVDGVDPFATMTDFGSALNSGYWNRVDLIVNTAKGLGMFVLMNPAYLGFSGTDEGWDDELLAESDADLQLYGQRLAQRYTQGNVGWCFGGDASPGATLKAKQLQILTGIRSVRTTDIVTGHSAPGAPAFTNWNGVAGYNLNSAYADVGDVYTACLTEFARTPTVPVFMIEAIYEQERIPAISAAGLRKQSYQALLSGACGQFFGNSPIWHFQASAYTFTSYGGTWQSNLNSTGSQHQAFVKQLFSAFAWQKLVPKTGTELVTTSLSSGDTRICPALASDGSFAMIWKPGSGNSTVNMAALSITSIRARFYDTTTGTYSTVTGSPFANSGTQVINWPGERVLVLDAP